MAKHQEGEKYLQSTQSYIDRYDLLTIEQCLEVVRMYQKIYKESLKAEKLKDMPDKEKRRRCIYDAK